VGANDEIAQNPNSHFGKILRFRDDGGVPADNPFSRRSSRSAIAQCSA
jgi:glucose/arabinose dehydrogenase